MPFWQRAARTPFGAYLFFALSFVLLVTGSIFLLLLSDVFWEDNGPSNDEDDDTEYDPAEDPFNINRYSVTNEININEGYYIKEGVTRYVDYEVSLPSDRMLKSLSITLTWQDEPDHDTGPFHYENNPDQFKLDAKWMDGDGYQGQAGPQENDHEQPQNIALHFEMLHFEHGSTTGQGMWNISMTCVFAGDFHNNPNAPSVSNDTGNWADLMIKEEIYYLI